MPTAPVRGRFRSRLSSPSRRARRGSVPRLAEVMEVRMLLSATMPAAVDPQQAAAVVADPPTDGPSIDFGSVQAVELADDSVAVGHLLAFADGGEAAAFAEQVADDGVRVLAVAQYGPPGQPTEEIDPGVLFGRPIGPNGPTIIIVTPVQPGYNPTAPPTFIGPPVYPNPFGPTGPYERPFTPSQPPQVQPQAPRVPVAPVDPNGGLKPPGYENNPPGVPTRPGGDPAPPPCDPSPVTPAELPFEFYPNSQFPPPNWIPTTPLNPGWYWTPGANDTWVQTPLLPSR